MRLAVALRRAVAQPSLFSELVVEGLWSVSDRRHRSRMEEYQHYTVSFEEAVSAIAGASPSQVEALLAEPEFLEALEEGRACASELAIVWQGGGADVHLLYVLCRLLRPATVVEMGVQDGWSTAFILHALEKNGEGHLHSVDLPAFHPKAVKYTGIAVPDRLKHRWTLYAGPQRKILPRLLSDLCSVDLVHYDSDKRYTGMISTYAAVWPRLVPKGVLISDDLNNDAFLDFAEAQDLEPLVVNKRYKDRVTRSPMGVLVRP